ncbi:hypothetical protein CesoFtcFv8_000619 [Champsocephalus esox]|uniref:Uncharacterized protein n=1 Tax=Champsocephalus esox TaxID=159716 RepID=A0AAN8D488_9TELE|nr:hypothetical protein CesoFtcFv8_000619 [Champsocephalus esox]
MRLSPPHWDFEASSFLPPSLGSALTCLTLPTVTCQHQHSSSGETEESRGPAEQPPLFVSDNSTEMDQNSNGSIFTK